ncbi:hypothetical protein [Geminocystis sp. NIES-3709]|uniref:hypothetical protein n=1 Tax=Geminocystis sp. NIES-3709 TaxID=1617448 RepID=UPI0005FCCF92|nr:hypothetical protein [Geminocystis sp. NIES-3709]BAQ65569.1 hypothetical protein GM3709_2334 [Geminocystis sp. NIES-3709]
MTLAKEKTEKSSKLALPSLSIFGTIDKEKINHFTPPYAVRNDCQIGQWKVGEDNLLGNNLEISIISTKNFYGNLGKTKQTSWLQVWFIASPKESRLPKNTICVTYLKTQSLSVLGQKVIEVMENKDPGLGIFQTSFSKHANDYGNYYSVNFQWRDREEDEIAQLHLIADFLKSSPILFDPNLPTTMIEVDAQGDPESLGEAKKQLKLLAEEAKEKAK